MLQSLKFHILAHTALTSLLSLVGGTGAQLANKDPFKYLGMVFNRTHDIAEFAECMLCLFVAGCHRIRQFA